ncbi:hypothetical protein [Streptomyces sp. NPDC003635]
MTIETPPTDQDFGWCAWHQEYVHGVRLVTVQDAGSGPGTFLNRFACAPCRQAHAFTPLDGRP